MKREITTVTWTMLTLFLHAQEIGFIETFSLAQDRGKVLQELVPGTDDAFYYQALHAQNRGERESFREIMAAWQQARKGSVGTRARELLNRQALLDYEVAPQQSLAYLKEELKLRFDHARKQGFRESRAPTRLDNRVISTDRLLDEALKRDPRGLDQVAASGLRAAAEAPLNASQRRSLLARLKRPDEVPHLPELILADLRERDSRGWGRLPIHQALTLKQLETLAQREPALRNDSGFVAACLARLAPRDEADIATEPAVREAYLDRLWRFVAPLDPVHNSLKAQVLYNRLDHDRRQGLYDRQRFLSYLALPRDVCYLRGTMRQALPHGDHLARLGKSFANTMLPPVSNEEPLVRDYLLHLLHEAADTEAYRPYLQDAFLKAMFAEAKILHGVGDVRQWASMLGPEAYQRIRDRAEITVAPDNPPVFGLEDPVCLNIRVKQVPTLLINVYDLNAFNIFCETGRPLDLAINLDGLAPTRSERVTFHEPAERRITRTLAFPEITGRGAYVIELIGNGMSSRALVQKGRLGVMQEVTAAGHCFTVADEAGERVTSVEGWLAGRLFHADETGRLLVPFTAAPKREHLVIRHGNAAVLCPFEHLEERYTLHLGAYVDREALLADGRARVAVRPVARVAGCPMSLKLLEAPRLTVQCTDLHGVTTEKVFTDLVLREDAEIVQEIRVPDQVVELHVILTARIRNVSRNRTEELADEARFTLNGIMRTPTIADLHAGWSAAGYKVELRGRNGEPIAGEPLVCAFKHRGFREPVAITLKTDVSGCAHLGALPEIAWFRVRTASGVARIFHTQQERCVWPAALHGKAGDTLRVPLLQDMALSTMSLLEMRRGVFVRDWHGALAAAGGFLELRGLPVGDYALTLAPDEAPIAVRVTAGAVRGNQVISARRALEIPRLPPVQITAITATAEQVEIRVANASACTRVHLCATRYLPDYDLFTGLGFSGLPPLQRQPWQSARTFYQSGREIGDEYRYVLERRQRAASYAGNLLERPGLLLNPWDVGETDAQKEKLSPGHAYDAQPDVLRQMAAREAMRKAEAAPAPEQGPALDFLAQAAVTLFNRVPDKRGRVVVPRDILKGLPCLRVMAVDPVTAVMRCTALEETSMALRDLRLARSLAPERRYAGQKRVTPLQRGACVVITNAASARYTIVDSTAKMYNLLAILHPDPVFKTFAFVAQWPALDEAKQRRLYARHACHELNCFLYHKDPRFFENVIAPVLRNKRDKTFMDHWLLGGDLRTYLEPWRFGRLNAAERALLAQRLREWQPSLARAVREQADLLAPDPERWDRCFDTAIQSGALEAERTEKGVDKPPSETMPVKPGSAPAPAASRAALSLMSAVTSDEKAPARTGAKARARNGGLSGADKAWARKAAGDARRVVRDAASPETRFFDAETGAREAQRRFYQEMAPTKEWAEHNYWRRPIEEQVADLIKPNAFWADVAAHDGKTPFLSPAVIQATRHATEMLMALAVLQVPFEAGTHEECHAEGRCTVRAASPLILFHREIREAAPAAPAGGVLVAQHRFRADDRERFEGQERVTQRVTDELQPRVVYGTRVVLTNPTGTRRTFSLLLQIPQGAIPVAGGFQTRSMPLTLEPYSTRTYEYCYTFPEPGTFTHYPATLAWRGQVVGAASSAPVRVVETPGTTDKRSWIWVSQQGSPEEVLSFLRQTNLYRVDLDQIAWRLKDRAFFDALVALLRGRHFYHDTTWSYGVFHHVPEVIRTWLSHTPFADQCGLWLEAPLLRLDPVARCAYQHLEYAPLVNPRVHRLGAKRTILNAALRKQYRHVLKVLSYKPVLNDEEMLAVAYYMALQDRVAEAIAWFDRVNREKIVEQVQADYLAAWLALCRGDLQTARKAATRHATCAVTHWRNRFDQVLAQLDALAGAAPAVSDRDSRDQTQAALAADEPVLSLRVEAGELHIRARHVAACTVNGYPMDIELLFSRNPFMQEGAAQFTFIQPAWSRTLDLAPGQEQVTLALPPAFASRNVMIEVLAGGLRRSQVCYANTLDVQLIETYGRLQVTHAKTGKPVSAAYVKVYARGQDGKVVFHKDGYTDLLGQFDYVSLNRCEWDRIATFAVLVWSDELGAVVQEAPLPKR